jgi:hypothetical protein
MRKGSEGRGKGGDVLSILMLVLLLGLVRVLVFVFGLFELGFTSEYGGGHLLMTREVWPAL